MEIVSVGAVSTAVLSLKSATYLRDKQSQFCLLPTQLTRDKIKVIEIRGVQPMPSPFPGVAPYLEHPNLWPEMHHWLISEIARFLSPQLRPKYRVAVEYYIIF